MLSWRPVQRAANASLWMRMKPAWQTRSTPWPSSASSTAPSKASREANPL